MSQIKFAVATAHGKSAIATVIVQGPNAISLVGQVFRPLNRKSQLAASALSDEFGQIVYGNWLYQGQVGEDLIVCVVNSEHVEIHCHGSIAALEIISQTLIDQGAEQLDRESMADLLAGGRYFGELSRAATKATTTTTAKILLPQKKLHADFWQTVRSELSSGQGEGATKLLDEYLNWQEFGLALTRPFKIVLCGSPNVGKSSLTNAILGFDRAIVHDIAGTTRDLISEVTAIAGWPVEITDTAGIRNASDGVERQGIEITRQSIKAADLIVLIVDLVEFDERELDQQIKNHRPDLVIGNKSDLSDTTSERFDLIVSATQRTNLNALMNLMVSRLVPQRPDDNAVIPVTKYHAEIAMKVRKAISEGKLEEANGLINEIIGMH